MEEQLKLLVALQDLDLMIKEAKDSNTSSELKDMGFKLDGLSELQQARENIDQYGTSKLARIAGSDADLREIAAANAEQAEALEALDRGDAEGGEGRLVVDRIFGGVDVARRPRRPPAGDLLQGPVGLGARRAPLAEGQDVPGLEPDHVILVAEVSADQLVGSV